MKTEMLLELEGIERLLRDRQFTEAKSRLASLEPSTVTGKNRAHYCLLMAEVGLYLNDYEIDDPLQYALNCFKYGSDTAKYARSKFLHGWLLTARGNNAEAREVLLEAYVHFKRCDMILDQARTLNRLGFLSFQLGETDTAVRQLKQSIGLYETSGDRKKASIVAVNLGSLFYSLGYLKRAIETFGAAKMRVLEQKANECSYYLNLSLPQAMLEDFNTAHWTIRKALPYLKDYVHQRAIYYENLGWIHLLEEDYPAAEKALLQGLAISLRIAPESALVSQIKRRLADACFGQAKYDAAQQYAAEALIVAEKIGERVEIAACDRVFAQLENNRDHHGAARDWFVKAIDIFSMIGSRYELATTRYLAAMSGVYQNGERQALLYLARAYFESEEVKPYLAKIDRALKKLPSPAVRPAGQAPTVIVESASMRKLVELARHVAQSDMAILLTGPTGTGKDLLSEYIHYHSGRSGRFVAVNTAAIPDGMVEAELFGYRKGAFTGADRDKAGLIDQAAGGTLYLNEIADSSPEFQAKLLDVLERRRVRALGDTNDHAVDFRLIAASNQDLAELVRQNRFRADLYHRLNQVNLTLPSLCDRREDIPVLVQHFVTACGIKPDEASGNGDGSPLTRLTATLSSHDWPGNVRELKAEIERLALVCERDLERMAAMLAAAPVDCDADRDHLMQLLEETNWNRSEVARLMGVSEGAIRYRIRALGLSPAKQ